MPSGTPNENRGSEVDLIERIKEARRKRDMLRADLSNLQAMIRYYSKRQKLDKVKIMQKEMEWVKEEYEKAKEEVWELVRMWQKQTRGKNKG